MYAIRMLPAEYGDCLWVEYGDAAKPKRILVDGGTPASYPALRSRLESLAPDDRHFELLVVTHIDIDHIGGVLPLLADAPRLGVTFGDVWFNGYEHVAKAAGILGGLQGEALSKAIVTGRLPWNAAFGGSMLAVTGDAPLPVADFEGMRITLLAPHREQLGMLADEWRETVQAAGLEPGIETRLDAEEAGDLLGGLDIRALAASRFKADTAKPNGSSIAFVATYDGRGALFGADAFPDHLRQSLERLDAADVRRISTFKIPHHGSRRNLNRELPEMLHCKTFLVSSSGKRFSHPNPESIARIIARGNTPRLCFNYRSEFTEIWDNKSLRRKHDYETVFGGDDGLRVEVA